MNRALVHLAGCLLLLLAPVAGEAAPIQDSTIVRFVASEQNLWGPGDAKAFEDDEPTGSGVQMGGIASGSRIDLTLRGDLGRVDANVEGDLRIRHDDVLSRKGMAPIDFMFDGITSESNVKTRVGANLKVDMLLRVLGLLNFRANLLDIDFGITTDNDYTFVTDVVTDSSGELQLAKLGADIVVAAVNANVKLTQTVFFEADGLQGKLTATHLASGFSRITGFAAESDAWVQSQMLFDKKGYWYLSLSELELVGNMLRQKVGAKITFEADVVGQTVVRVSADVDLWESTPFALAFDSITELDGGYLVYVGAEPAAVPLLALGIAGLAASRARRRRA